VKTLSEGGQQSLTTDAVHATPVQVAGVDPEWLDAVGVRGVFSIKRSLLYELDEDGLIESVSLRRRGRTRGKRLFCVASIRAFLREQMEVAK
jgi:hypothetical protein